MERGIPRKAKRGISAVILQRTREREQMITLPLYMQPTSLEKRVIPCKRLMAFLDKEADKHRRKFRIQDWVVIHLPAPYNEIEEISYYSNIAITQDTMTFMRDRIGVKAIIKAYGINWCIIY